MKQVFAGDRQVVTGRAPVDVREVEPGVFSVIRDGRSYELRAVSVADEGVYDVIVDGREFRLEVRDPREFSRRSGSAFGSGRQNVNAAMPGKVVRVLVKDGDEVEAGQGLVVVEAMKMQNEMKASKPGRVLKVHVKDGDTVGAGQALVVIE